MRNVWPVNRVGGRRPLVALLAFRLLGVEVTGEVHPVVQNTHDADPSRLERLDSDMMT
jgi:hypothetical protein